MTNIKIVEHVVQELPSERPLVVGHKYKVIQADGTLIEYVINSQGEPVRLKGITNDESSRLDRLSSEQISKVESITTGDITKLKEDYTKEQIDDKISDLGNLANSSKISLGDSTELPVPPQSGGVTIPNAWVELAQNVTYTQAGGSPLTGIDGHRSIAEWDNDNEEWILVDMGALPEPENKIPDWVEGETYTGGISPDQVLESGQAWRVKPSVTSTTERPSESDDWEPMIYVDVHVSDVDRPDLEEFKVIDEVENIVFKTNPFDYHRVEPIEGVDRPDIALIVVDSNGNVIWTSEDKSSGGGGSVDIDSVREVIKTSELITTFWEPPVQEAYNSGSSNAEYWLNLDYWGLFDEVRVNQKTAQGYDPYVTRELLGESTSGGYDIYRYEFKPPNPTRKVVVISSIHGSERIPAMVTQRFFKALCEDWMHDPTLTWARHNIHFVVLPLANPSGFHVTNRRVWETDPIPATWTKSGTTVTVSFNISDFPNNNPNVSANNYFTASEGVAGNTWISLIDSSDQDAVPDDGYRIATVVDGQTVTVTTEESGGASSGTCNIFVSTDPNRGFDLPAAPWANSTTSSAKSAFSDPVGVAYNNKGTKPYSLNETKFVADTFDLHSDATFAVDMHNGAADYDTRYGTGLGIDLTPLNSLNAMHASFTDGNMPISSSTSNVASQYGSRMHDINSFTIEWGQHNNITEEIATESQRWMTNFILICSRFYNKKINE